MIKTNFFLTLVLVILLLMDASAQRRRLRSIASITPWEIGLSGGISTFVTSVNPEPGAPTSSINYWNREVNPGIGLAVVRNFSPTIGIELNWLNTSLSGTWNNNYPHLPISVGHEVPLTFKSQINQIDLMAAFNLNQMLLPGDEDDIWHLFVKPGIGITNTTDTKKFYPGITSTRMSIVLDAGFSISLSETIKLMLGSAFRIVNTDNLDGVHVTSTDINGETKSWMKVFEIYNFTYLRVSYSLGSFGSKKSKSANRNRSGINRIFRRN